MFAEIAQQGPSPRENINQCRLGKIRRNPDISAEDQEALKLILSKKDDDGNWAWPHKEVANIINTQNIGVAVTWSMVAKHRQASCKCTEI